MSNDLIRRQDAIDAIRASASKYTGFMGMEMYTDDDAVEAINSVPSAQPEPQWIPCSESLPEDYEDVLVWFEYFRYGSYNRLYQTHGIGDYSSEFDSWIINHQTGWHQLRVIAWMPLPDPPKGEQE